MTSLLGTQFCEEAQAVRPVSRGGSAWKGRARENPWERLERDFHTGGCSQNV